MAARRGDTTARPLRAYVDTSVFGGVHDDEFRVASEKFFRGVREGGFVLLSSEPLVIEIAGAPKRVQDVFQAHEAFMEPVFTSEEATGLADAYLRAKVVPAASHVDALHVALASVARADVVVSWNFKHLVQLRRIRAFHAVNLLRGYPLIEIRSPLEVIDGED